MSQRLASCTSTPAVWDTRLVGQDTLSGPMATRTGIVVSFLGAKPHGLAAFVLRTRISIDGKRSPRKFGNYFFEATPGEHSVAAELRYFGLPAGKAAKKVNVTEGQQAHIAFRTRPSWSIRTRGDSSIP